MNWPAFFFAIAAFAVLVVVVAVFQLMASLVEARIGVRRTNRLIAVLGLLLIIAVYSVLAGLFL